MESVLMKLLTFLYACIGIVSLIGYLPTIIDLSRKRNQSANIQSYFTWSCATLITLLYSIFIVHDFWFIIASAISFSCCVTIFFLSLSYEKQSRQKKELIPEEIPIINQNQQN